MWYEKEGVQNNTLFVKQSLTSKTGHNGNWKKYNLKKNRAWPEYTENVFILISLTTINNWTLLKIAVPGAEEFF